MNDVLNIGLLLTSRPWTHTYLKNPPEGVIYKNLLNISLGCAGGLKVEKNLLYVIKQLMIKCKGIGDLYTFAGYLTHLGLNLDEIQLIHALDFYNPKLSRYINHIIELQDNACILFEHKMHLVHSTFFKRFIEKSLINSKCKKILVHFKMIENGIKYIFKNPKINDKIEIFPLAMPVYERSKKDTDIVEILYIAGAFELKGGFQVLKAFEKLLLKGYKNIHLTMISNVPIALQEKFKKYNHITIVPPQNHNIILEKYYPKADIFVLPSYVDIPVVLIEAMAFGLPIISVNSTGISEIVIDGKNGFLVNSPVFRFDANGMPHYEIDAYLNTLPEFTDVTNEIMEKLIILIEDKILKNKISEYNKKEVESGRFSLHKHNTRLKKIYEESI